MKIKEAWKHVLSLVALGCMMIAYPVLAGTATPPSAAQTPGIETSFADAAALVSAVRDTGVHIREVQMRARWESLRFHTQQEAELFLQTIARTAAIPVWKEEVRDEVRIYRGETKDGTGIKQDVYVHLRTTGRADAVTGGLGVTFRGKEEQVALIKGITVNYARITENSSELPQIITCVTGIYNGKLENDLQKKKANQLLASLKGNMVESLEEETVLSYSAYSPLFHTVIATNHKSMNLQVAAHYDTYMQETVITAGIPIITAEY
ncbi:YwmB family TATA-box binding protein [Aneurinibacillus sp. BA2021]|nr:YwmB family TATA-box binding protein [Aneurinibacillus sp. BA2021]